MTFYITSRHEIYQRPHFTSPFRNDADHKTYFGYMYYLTFIPNKYIVISKCILKGGISMTLINLGVIIGLFLGLYYLTQTSHIRNMPAAMPCKGMCPLKSQRHAHCFKQACHKTGSFSRKESSILSSSVSMKRILSFISEMSYFKIKSNASVYCKSCSSSYEAKNRSPMLRLSAFRRCSSDSMV